ncbi:MAG TPA: molybdopterin-binding protein [Azospirillaceae bacterium]|nr:molybdopterin-binding protein [Azospirillaceae bacterium]
MPTAAILIIGNEILSGRTKDANVAFLAERLGALGIPVREVRVVPDAEAEIVAAVNALRERYAYVFTTGGIGPTHDDITAACIAKAFDAALERNPQAVTLLENHYEPGQLNEARLRMANIPAGGILIDNPVSKAPGFQIGNVFVLPGVPCIMQAMFDGLTGRLQGGPPVLSRTVTCLLPEGRIATELSAVQDRHPTVEIGSYPYLRNGQIGTSLVMRGTDPMAVEAAATAVADLTRAYGDDPVITPGANG